MTTVEERSRGGRTVVGSTERLVTRPFVVVTSAVLVVFVYIGMLAPVVPLFVERELGGGELGLGLNAAVFSGAAIASWVFLGRLADRYGRRALMIAGALLCGVAGAALGQSDTLATALGLRAIAGVGEAMVFVGGATLVADLAPARRRAEAASYFSVAVFGGLGVGPILGEAVLDEARFGRAFAVAGISALVGAVVAVFAPARVVSAEQAAGVTPPPPIARTGWAKLVHPAAVLPGVVLACAVVPLAAFVNFIPDHSRAVGMGASGGLFALYAFLSLAIRIVGAKLPERLGPRRSVTIALSLLAVAMSVLALVGSEWALWLGAGLVGLGVAFNYPSLMALTVNRVDDADRASVVSSFTMFFEVGTAIGGLALGPLAEIVGKQRSFFGGAAACLLGIYVLRRHVVPVGAPDAAGATARP